MKMTLVPLVAILWLVGAPALAQDTSCAAAASERKLAGAAKTSFLTKCEKDARARCDVAATEKKLHGAARNSHVNKCVRDAVGG